MSDLNEELERLEQELAQNYPGSRHPRRSVTDRTERPDIDDDDDEPWDKHPLTKRYKGELREFFLLGALCKALGRPPVTVRLWERQGHFPPATLRQPVSKGSVPGTKGRRLYSREQIEAVIRIAGEHGFLNSPRVVWAEHPTFHSEVAKAWLELKKQEATTT